MPRDAQLRQCWWSDCLLLAAAGKICLQLSAGEPILALLLVDLDLHGLLTSSAHFLQQARHFLPSSCFNCALGKASSILASLHTLHGYLMARVELALAHDLPVLALRAHGGHVGPRLLPLLMFKAIQMTNLLTPGASSMRVQAFCIGDQVHVLTPELLQEQLGPIGDAPLK